MDKKPFYKSSEVWVLGLFGVILLSRLAGVELNDNIEEMENYYMALSPIAVLILRLFNTRTKLTLK